MDIDQQAVQRVMDVVRTAARQLVGADGVTFVRRDGDYCLYLEEDAVGPLWKGQRFPLDLCVSGWVISNDAAAVIPDIYSDPRVLVEAYRPTFVRSMAMVPFGRPPIGAIGAYWARPHEATQSQLETLAAIADSALIQTGS
jgi:hypothetical protein